MIPPRTPTRTVRPASVSAPLVLPASLWISPFRGLVGSLCIVRFLSTPVYPESPRPVTRGPKSFGLGLPHVPDRAAVLLGDLLDGELRRRDDRAPVRAVARIPRPPHREVAAAPVAGHLHAGDVREPGPRRLQQRRDGRARDVLAGLALPGMAAGKNRRQPVTAVSAKANLEHRGAG